MKASKLMDVHPNNFAKSEERELPQGRSMDAWKTLISEVVKSNAFGLFFTDAGAVVCAASLLNLESKSERTSRF